MLRRQFILGSVGLLLRDPCLDRACRIISQATSPGWLGSAPEVQSAVLHVSQGNSYFTRAFGKASSPTTVFLIASITKPMVATALMILRDRRELSLDDLAVKYLPEFSRGSQSEVRIRHLLTHSAGLQVQVTRYQELVLKKAPLQDYFHATCQLDLLFRPGTAVSYSNLGMLLIKMIIERVTNIPLEKFLQAYVFVPLGMTDSSLGLGSRRLDETAQVQTSGVDDPNSEYWRNLKTPWGGVHSTAPDVDKLLRFFLNSDSSMLATASAAEMVRNQNPGLNQPWGLGWMLANSHDVSAEVAPDWRRYGWPTFVAGPLNLPAFGFHCSARSFGHYGVTGTVAWADPDTQLCMTLLTTRKARFSRDGILGPVSDLVSAGVTKGPQVDPSG